MEVGGRELDAGVEHIEEIVGNDTFHDIVIAEAEADPEAVELGAAEEGFALGFEVVGELADEVDRADFGKRDFFVFAVGSEQVDGVGLAEPGRI